MANIKASKKDIRRIKVRTERNRYVKSRLKTLRKQLDTAMAGDDLEAKKKCVARYFAALDKAAKRNVIHSNKVNRHKSIFSKKLAQPTEATEG